MQQEVSFFPLGKIPQFLADRVELLLLPSCFIASRSLPSYPIFSQLLELAKGPSFSIEQAKRMKLVLRSWLHTIFKGFGKHRWKAAQYNYYGKGFWLSPANSFHFYGRAADHFCQGGLKGTAHNLRQIWWNRRIWHDATRNYYWHQCSKGGNKEP